MPNDLPVYYVSGAPAVHSVDFYNSSALKNFIHTITGGLMFAKNNELKIEPETGNAAGETVGAAYYWQSGVTVEPQANPALMLDDNGTVVLNLNDASDASDASWTQTKDKDKDMIIPCPDENFSGYLHVVVWNEVGTCTQYVYKAETGSNLKLTNYGVFNCANNGVAVFVTTPDGEEVKAYTPDRDVLDESGKQTRENNWVQQVDFDVQWDRDKLVEKAREGYVDSDTDTYTWDDSKTTIKVKPFVVVDGQTQNDETVKSGCEQKPKALSL